MKTLYFGLCPGMAIAILAGCGSQVAPAGGVPQGAMTKTSFGLPLTAIRHTIQSGTLLYVVGTGHVYIFTYPKGSLVGQTKITEGSDDCSDKRGDVFATGYDSVSVFAHGDTKPRRTLSVPGDAYACSVDPTTGNLAVLGTVGVMLFKKAKGKYELLNEPTFVPRQCGYDDKGNLFVDGYLYTTFKFAELPKGSANFIKISVGQNIVGGEVQWDGKYITVEDDGGYGVATIYRLQVSGSRATIVGKTRLTQASMMPLLSWIYDGAIIVPYSIGSSYKDVAVGFWNYPTGGKATKTIAKSLHSPEALSAVTISAAPK
jgi:hypothetical protein